MGSGTNIGTAVGTAEGLDPTAAAGADTLATRLVCALAASGVVALCAVALHFLLGDPPPWQWEAWWHLITTRPGFVDVVRLVSSPTH